MHTLNQMVNHVGNHMINPMVIAVDAFRAGLTIVLVVPWEAPAATVP